MRKLLTTLLIFAAVASIAGADMYFAGGQEVRIKIPSRDLSVNRYYITSARDPQKIKKFGRLSKKGKNHRASVNTRGWKPGHYKIVYAKGKARHEEDLYISALSKTKPKIFGRPTLTPDGNPLFVKGELLVKFNSEVISVVNGEVQLKRPSLVALAQKLKVKQKKQYFKLAKTPEQIRREFPERSVRISEGVEVPDLSTVCLLRIPEDADVWEAVNQFSANPDVEYAEPNYIGYADKTPNDPLFPDLWGMQKIEAEKGWDTETGNAGIVVAVVDTGVDYNHEDLNSNIWINPLEDINSNGQVDPADFNGIDDDDNGYIDDIRGWDFVYSDSDPMDGHSHGTHVSGTIAGIGDNNIGVVGVTWNCKIMPVRIMDDGGYTNGNQSLGIEYAAENGADVMNNSWGGYGISETEDLAVKYAESLGVVVVTAAGNDTENALLHNPANSEYTLTISSFTDEDKISWFSNYGIKIDVAAPGSGILSTVPGNEYDSMSGTSMAAPHVAGLAALILSQNPMLTPEQVRQVIRNSADDVGTPGWDKESGYGRINVDKALKIDSACEANITSPTVSHVFCAGNMIDKALSIVSGMIAIGGIASGPNFKEYRVEYGSGENPQNWTTILTSDLPVVDGVLVDAFDVSNVASGLYTLKLIVEDTDGNYYEDKAQINVGVFGFISYPIRKRVVIANTLDVYGIAEGQNFKNYHFEYGLGWDPNEWYLIGDEMIIAVEGEGEPNGLIIDSPLLYQALPLDEIPEGKFVLKLVIEDSFGGIYEDKIPLRKDLTNFNYQEGWPADTLNTYSNLAVGDLDNDGKNEIVYGFHQTVRILSSDGVLKKSFEVQNGYSYADIFYPTLGDLDGDGNLEIGILSREGNKLYINLYRHSGELLPGWPKEVTNYLDWRARKAIVFRDVDGDDQLDVIWGTCDSKEGETKGRVYVYKSNGELIWQQDTVGPVLGTPAVGDIDHDGWAEVVALDFEGYGYAWNHDGTLVSENWLYQYEEGKKSFGNPILADLNHDGYREIFFSNSAPSMGHLRLLKYDGSKILLYPWCNFGSAGDIDNDGEIEIVGIDDMDIIGTKDNELVVLDISTEVYAVKMSDNSTASQPFFILNNIKDTLARHINYGYCHLIPLVGDVDGDNNVEIVIAREESYAIYGVDHDATLIADPRWPIWRAGEGLSSIICDLDGDGDTEIISLDKEVKKIFVWDLPFTYHSDKMEWPMFQHDAKHTGCYNKPPIIESFSPVNLEIMVTEQDPPLNFAITASDPDLDVLKYQWELDGNVVSTANNYDYAGNGSHKLKVMVSDGDLVTDMEWKIKVEGEEVPPTITLVAPNARAQGWSGNITISGDDFQNGAGSDFGSDITVNSTNYISSSLLSADLIIAEDASTGLRDVTVTNLDGKQFSKHNAFEVSLKPVINQVIPNNKAQGWKGEITVYGDNFQGEDLSFSGEGITVDSVVCMSYIDAKITIAEDAPLGSRDLILVNSDGGQAIKNNAFTVSSKKLSIVMLEPNKLKQGESEVVFVGGSGFKPGLELDFGEGIEIDLDYNNGKHYITDVAAVAFLDVLDTAQPGLREVTVTNPEGENYTAQGIFEVLGKQYITSVNPDNGVQGWNGWVNISGGGFEQGAIPNFGSSIEVESTNYLNAGYLNANITIANNAVTGLREVTLTNLDGSQCSKSDVFMVKAEPSKPIIASISPETGLQDWSGDVAIMGEKLLKGATAKFYISGDVNNNGGVNINSVTHESDAKLIANISIANNAILGDRNILVINPSQLNGYKTDCFTVIAQSVEPTIVNVSPTQGKQGETVEIEVTGEGTHFDSTTQVHVTSHWEGEDLPPADWVGDISTASNVQVISPTKIKATFNISADANFSKRNVGVSTPNINGTGKAEVLWLNQSFEIVP